jgi:hypothetical protein
LIYFAGMKSIQTFFTLISVAVWLFVVYSFVSQKQAVPEKHIEVVLRDIGHRILLLAKDSTSRVLPIVKINDHTYQISFENAFKFETDTLINLVSHQLAKHDLPKDYMVSVLNCQKLQTIFAYEINSVNYDILACKGRKQETACYLIHIDFLKSTQDFRMMTVAGLLTLGTGVLFWYIRKRRRRFINENNHDEENNQMPIENFDSPGNKSSESKENLADENPTHHIIKLGLISFYPDKNRLIMHDGVTIALSDRETKLLHIFTEHVNEVVERDQLVKEVWEDEGILVMSRNLDVFVSKLRKKLSADPSIKILNVHGKGYRLMVE